MFDWILESRAARRRLIAEREERDRKIREARAEQDKALEHCTQTLRLDKSDPEVSEAIRKAGE